MPAGERSRLEFRSWPAALQSCWGGADILVCPLEDFPVAHVPDWKIRRWSFYFCEASRGSFVSLYEGSDAFFAAGGLAFTAEDPLGSPFSRGTKVNSQPKGPVAGLESPANRQARKPAP